MKQKDDIDTLFEGLQGTFDVHETPDGHQSRFMERLNANPQKSTRTNSWWKPLSIAASIVLLVSIAFTMSPTEPEEKGLASISPEMEQTQSFFVSAIHQELETLKSFESEDTKALIDDTLRRLSLLETNYDQLKTDLEESGNDKRVISAMIENFQNRIEILEQVNQTIEEIKTLKSNRKETTL
jgi:hypothetical protein